MHVCIIEVKLTCYFVVFFIKSTASDEDADSHSNHFAVKVKETPNYTEIGKGIIKEKVPEKELLVLCIYQIIATLAGL